MSGHTPGPWEFEVETSDSGGWRARQQCVRIWNGATLIADYDTSACEYADDAENEANARLIAAAPDLLAALEMVRDADNDCRDDGLPCIPAIARGAIDGAIAKATGDQP